MVEVYKYINDIYVTEDPNDIRSGKTIALLDSSSSLPGYCKLRLLEDPVVAANRINVAIVNGSAFLRNTRFYDNLTERQSVLKGPALHIPEYMGLPEQDFVMALDCKTWPKDFRLWSPDNKDGHWPKSEIIDFAVSCGCFVVPTAHCLSENQKELEWRISTSSAERCLMFNLNITELRCYILLKMILKTFIKSHFTYDTITSYHCKTVLFHCIENSRHKLWTERNLFKCVTVCLCFLLDCLKVNRLPNYFNDKADLFLGKFDFQLQGNLVQIVDCLLKSKGDYLKEIGFDGLNLLLRYGVSSDNLYLKEQRWNVLYIKTLIMYCEFLLGRVRSLVRDMTDDSEISASAFARVRTATENYSKLGEMEFVSSCTFLSNISSHVACITATRRLENGEDVGTDTEIIFKQSLNSDIMSSRLKYASLFICTGHQEQAVSILREMEEKLFLGKTIYWDVCCCKSALKRFVTVIEKDKQNPYLTTGDVAFCVMFTDAEKQCCPQELQYEMFRTITLNDRLIRDEDGHEWMGSGVVDPLPFFFFLKYKVSLHLGSKREREDSLQKLCACTNDHMGLPHRETAYNLLGQCWELEHEPVKAFHCYYMSLLDRQTNNSARWHIAILAFNI